MATRIEIEPVAGLTEHALHGSLAHAVEALREEARPVAEALQGRTVWMVNSTARGGGVSEMLPGIITHMRELGIAVEWVVINSDDEHFFELTKRIHNLLHGGGRTGLSAADRDLYESVNRDNAESLRPRLREGDVLIVHDPQPMPLAGMLADTGVVAIWRCHIGLDVATDETTEAWRFLEPYADAYDHAVFSAPEYVPPFLEGRSSIVYPALDPLTPKNRPLHVQETVALLERSGLLQLPGPRLLPPFEHAARRLQADGTFAPAARFNDFGLLTRPIITQVSRWDRLKGFLPLLHGFAEFKRQARENPPHNDDQRRRVGLARLVLAGPDPDSVADDPEGAQVFDELKRAYAALDDHCRADVAIVALPMHDATENALIVNALQRVSTLIVQNSLREGFGLTITEAMWKGIPVLSNSAACGPRQQVRDSVDGRMIADPSSPGEIAAALAVMLSDHQRLSGWGLNAQRQVYDHFLIYAQLGHWLRLLARLRHPAEAA